MHSLEQFNHQTSEQNRERIHFVEYALTQTREEGSAKYPYELKNSSITSSCQNYGEEHHHTTIQKKDDKTTNELRYESRRGEDSLMDSSAFISRWNTYHSGVSNYTQIKLPLQSCGSYDFTINWGDKTTNKITTWNQPEVTHTYETGGSYTLTITGTIEGWSFNNTGDKRKIIEISQWGNLNLGNGGSYFYGCFNLVLTATDAPNMTDVTTMYRAFRGCESLGTMGNMSSWAMGSVTTMREMFYQAKSFNQPIGNWNTSKVVDMSYMFWGAWSFNQPLNNWNTSSVTTMRGLFYYASSFNQSLNNWNTSSVITMKGMFYGASSFNQPLNSWNVSSVTNMNYMFYGASSFNQDLSSWDVSRVLDMDYMFGVITLSTSNYDDLLINWSQQSLQSNVLFHGGYSKYSSAAASARKHIIDTFNWIITDGGEAIDNNGITSHLTYFSFFSLFAFFAPLLLRIKRFKWSLFGKMFN